MLDVRIAAVICSSLIAVSAFAGVSPEELTRKAVQNFQRNYQVTALKYTYMEADVDSDGSEKTSVGRVFPVNGLPYEFETSRNGTPLNPEQLKKEQGKLDARKSEGKEEREKRIRNYLRDRAFLNEVPEAFACKVSGEQELHARANYVLDCDPKPGYHAVDSRAAMFSHIHARIYIDKDDLQMTRAEAKVLETISFGWILARIGPGADMNLEQTRLTDSDWLPSLIDVNGTARILLIHDHPIHERITYYDFKPINGNAAAAMNISKLGL
jgi:hypothetical protein